MLAAALTIAGSDPSGGAGIQADLKTFHQFGVYGEAAVTLITVQNTRSVSRVEPLPPQLVAEQIHAVLADIPPAAIKTGALGTAAIIERVADALTASTAPIVVDPVMVSKHGARLLPEDAVAALRTRLFPRAALVTPNIEEAEALTGIAITNEPDMLRAAARILDSGCTAVLIKGGHLPGAPIDLLVTCEGAQRFPGERILTRHTHGTGCTYSAAITAGLALGRSLPHALSAAKYFIGAAIATAPGLGAGHGPVNHFAAAPPRQT